MTPRITVALAPGSVKGRWAALARAPTDGYDGCSHSIELHLERWSPVVRLCLLLAALGIPAARCHSRSAGRTRAGRCHPDGKARRRSSTARTTSTRRWGILVVNAKTGETVYERNAETMLAPASVTKLFSCAAALVALGPDSHDRNGRLSARAGGQRHAPRRPDPRRGRRPDVRRPHEGRQDRVQGQGPHLREQRPRRERTDRHRPARRRSNDLAKQIKDAGITQIDGES